ncbi:MULTISPECIES: alanine racemase [unclassified Oceanispirochaeta]|uniref:alanine racemase n=1 Tax=unclassified Oceanispirochaeta TaxID=2635722 RepID=UPI001314D569|nr:MULTISPECIES: alanine racemase [unclassified Oceanispirochaeta]MBF9015814.1 alanine racemase [Oceanispirochaeta sp. M2]NPD72277.1 alanine racemase [Oceanispirochaeta sp. M1]
MAGPEIIVDINKIRENTRTLVDFCSSKGIRVTGVTKVTCGMPLVARAMLEGGVVSIGESRIENIQRLRSSGINAPVMMLRIPPLSGVDEIVTSVDISLNSELSVICSLSEAAVRKGKIHKIILMVDLGDLREGIWPSDLMEICREVVKLRGVKIAGIGTNLTCFGGVLPSRKNMTQLVTYAQQIEERFGLEMEIISGGNSSSLPLLMEGGMPARINHLRLGESIALGRETVKGTLWPGCHADAFQLSAELIELKKKPSVPIGETGMDAFGKTPVFSDKGDILRGILSVGREDVVIDNLIPVDSGISVLGASSDHLLIDVTGSSSDLSLGDKVNFNLNYGALLAAMTSGYVKKTPITGEEGIMKSKNAVLMGNSPTFTEEILLNHLTEMGFEYEISTKEITEGLIAAEIREKKIPLIGGEQNCSVAALRGMAKALDQAGLIIFSPNASLLTEGDESHSFLAEILGLKNNGINLSSKISPESIVIIGLRDAERSEVELIREHDIQVYTMEDIDLLGMREVMINALRKVTTGTEGFYARLSTDVIKAEGEGLTFREAHLAMEMIADSANMKAFDISGTPDRSWIDDKGLCNLVGSAFGKRILKL